MKLFQWISRCISVIIIIWSGVYGEMTCDIEPDLQEQCQLPRSVDGSSVEELCLKYGCCHAQDPPSMYPSCYKKVFRYAKTPSVAPPTAVTDCTPRPPVGGYIYSETGSVTFPINVMFEYRCNDGATLVGISRNMCFSNGQLALEMPTCKAKTSSVAPPTAVTDCTPQPPVGGYIYSETGSVTFPINVMFEYRCNDGATLVGISRNMCMSNGQLALEIPTCKANTPSVAPPTAVTDCTPQPPEGGYIYSETGSVTFPINVVFEYRCNDGATLVGTSRNMCMSNGQLALEIPTCKAKTSSVTPPTAVTDCTPRPPVGGYIYSETGTVTFPINVVFEYRCNDGATLVGISRNMCMSNGQLAVEIPTCKAKTSSVTPPTAVTDCTPRPPVGGYIYSETGTVTFPINVVFEYRCNDGATLVGISRNMCMSNGQLAVEIPTCKANTPSVAPPTAVTDCTPQPPEGGYIYSETGSVTFPINVVFEYRCNDGATLVGTSRNMCMSNGQLALEIPTCKAKTSSVTPPTAVTDCTPRPPVGGYIYSETGTVTFPINVVFEYRCNDGATLVGISRNMCMSNGQLAVEIPTCKAKTSSVTPPTAVTDCTPRPPVGGYIYSETGTVTFPINVVFEYRCNDGATLVGISRNMCMSNGQLAVEIPTCKANTPSVAPPTAVTDCTPQPPEGGYIYSETGSVTFPINVVFEYRCNDGATLVGTSRNMCMSNGQLALEIPTCKAKTPSVAPPTAVTDCTPQPPVGGYIYSETGSVTFPINVIFEYRCNDGATLVGISRNMCFSNGQLAVEIPTCKAKTPSVAPPTAVTDCTPQPPVGGYIYSETGSVTFPINVIFEYRCNDGATLVGISRNMCFSNGQLAVEIPTCKKN